MHGLGIGIFWIPATDRPAGRPPSHGKEHDDGRSRVSGRPRASGWGVGCGCWLLILGCWPMGWWECLFFGFEGPSKRGEVVKCAGAVSSSSSSFDAGKYSTFFLTRFSQQSQLEHLLSLVDCKPHMFTLRYLPTLHPARSSPAKQNPQITHPTSPTTTATHPTQSSPIPHPPFSLPAIPNTSPPINTSRRPARWVRKTASAHAVIHQRRAEEPG